MENKKEVARLRKILENITVKQAVEQPELLDELAYLRIMIDDFFKVIKPIHRPLNL